MSTRKELFIFLWLLALVGCARNPVTGRREVVLVSEGQEIAMGQESHEQVRAEYGFVADPDLQTYIQTVGQKLAIVSHRPNLDWHFTVVDSPVVNAFAIPGGYVYLTRGILAYIGSEAELAGVMGHEIGHVTARHTVRQLTRTQLAQIGVGVGSVLSPTFGQLGDLANSALGLMFLRFSRDDEREADTVGVEYAAKSRYDPREVSNFFEVLQQLSQTTERETLPAWLSTHPEPGERVQTTRTLAQNWVQQLNLIPDQMTVNHDGHLRNIDGMVFGDNPREGFLEGQRFYHPELGFQIVFPPDWQVENTRSAVYGLDPRQMAQMQLSAANVPAGTTGEAYARQLADQGLVPRSVERVIINGNPAFLGLYSIQSEGGTQTALAAFIEYRERLYEIVGVTPDFARYGEAIEQSIHTFEQVTDQRILRAQPDRMTIYTARPGDTLMTIAARLNNPRAEADDLAILNRIGINQPLATGRLIKIVERGY